MVLRSLIFSSYFQAAFLSIVIKILFLSRIFKNLTNVHGFQFYHYSNDNKLRYNTFRIDSQVSFQMLFK